MARRPLMIKYRNEYIRKYEHYPRECCVNIIKRWFYNDPYPYRYDYEILEENEPDSVTKITIFLKFVAQSNRSGYENPLLRSLKRGNNSLRSNDKMILNSTQYISITRIDRVDASEPVSSRSFLLQSQSPKHKTDYRNRVSVNSTKSSQRQTNDIISQRSFMS